MGGYVHIPVRAAWARPPASFPLSQEQAGRHTRTHTRTCVQLHAPTRTCTRPIRSASSLIFLSEHSRESPLRVLVSFFIATCWWLGAGGSGRGGALVCRSRVEGGRRTHARPRADPSSSRPPRQCQCPRKFGRRTWCMWCMCRPQAGLPGPASACAHRVMSSHAPCMRFAHGLHGPNHPAHLRLCTPSYTCDRGAASGVRGLLARRQNSKPRHYCQRLLPLRTRPCQSELHPRRSVPRDHCSTQALLD